MHRESSLLLYVHCSLYHCTLPYSMQFYLHICSFILNTCVDPPHEQRVTCLTFQPKRSQERSAERQRTTHGNSSLRDCSVHPALLVSTSLDGKFKTWILVDGRGREGEMVSPSWACRSVGYYHNLPCQGAAFCEDGSLLSVNFHKVSQSLFWC